MRAYDMSQGIFRLILGGFPFISELSVRDKDTKRLKFWVQFVQHDR